MLVVPSNIGPPSTITIVFKAVNFTVDLTAVTAVTYNVTRRDGTTDTWEADIVSATPGELVSQYTFADDGEIAGTGAYSISASLAVPGGSITAATVTLFVTSPNGLQAQTEQTAWVLETVPIPSMGAYRSEWVVVGPSDSPYQAIATSPWIAVDLRTGSVEITLWEGANGDQVLTSDVFHTGSMSRYLTLTSADGLVPIGDGTFSGTAEYENSPGLIQGLKFTDGYWFPWEGAFYATAVGYLVGDVTGPIASNVVEKIHGATVPAAGSLTPGNVAQVSGASAITYAPVNLAGGSDYVTGALPTGNQAPQTLTGDATGTTAAVVIGRVHGATLPAAGALTPGNVPQVTGVAALSYAPINLAGGADYVTGTLPTSNQAVQVMGGDATGTTAAATVTGIQTRPVDATAPSTGQAYVWDGDSWAPGTNFGAQDVQTTGNVNLAASGTPSVGRIRVSNTTTPIIASLAPSAIDMVFVTQDGYDWKIGNTVTSSMRFVTWSAGAYQFEGSDGTPYLLVQVGASARVRINAPVAGYSVYSFTYRKLRANIAFASDANKTLSAAEYENPILTVTGTIGAARQLRAPSGAGYDGTEFTVHNNTTGGFDITVTRSDGGGTGVSIPNGERRTVYYDATNNDYFNSNG